MHALLDAVNVYIYIFFIMAATFTTSCVLTSKLPSGINSSSRRLPMMRCLR